MSLLQQATTEIDDAALGEEFTKGSTHLVWAAGIATVLVSIGIALYFILGQKPTAATGEVMQVWAEPLTTQTSGVDASGAPVPVQTVEQVLVFAQVRLHNQSKDPLVLRQILTNAVMGDSTVSSYAAIPADYDRLFEAYPQLTSPHGAAIASRQTIPPGQSVEGEFVSAFHMNKADWDKHKGLDFTFVFDYQPFLKLAPKSPVP
jgi:hypothetical protein